MNIQKKHIAGIFSELKFIVVVLTLAVIFRTTAFGMYHIPSESMLPTLAVGDRIVVVKFAYGFSRHSLPFSMAPGLPTESQRLFGRIPERGDIVVFKHPRTGETYIKRVVGLPHDQIELRDGRVLVNGTSVNRKAVTDLAYREYEGRVVQVRVFEEALGEDLGNDRGKSGSHKIYERSDRGRSDTMTPVTVPEGHLFVLGDNRDNSIDSRYFDSGVGFLPVENLVGQAVAIPFSIHKCRKEPGVTCLKRPWFSSIR